MDKKRFLSIVLIGGPLAALILVAMILFRGGPRDELNVNRPKDGTRSREQMAEVGGIKRPITDIRAARPQGDVKAESALGQFDIGTTPPVPIDANPQVKSVVEALKTGKHPERVSSLVTPKPFDQAAYLANPDAYLNIVEPGRIWQVAQPGKGVPRMTYMNDRFQTIEQGQSATLKVQAIKDAPVTFTSFDLGAFHNQLTSVTVRADAKGVAQAVFTGTRGTINNVNILVGSPMTSGQLKFTVNVEPPRRSVPIQSPKK